MDGREGDPQLGESERNVGNGLAHAVNRGVEGHREWRGRVFLGVGAAARACGEGQQGRREDEGCDAAGKGAASCGVQQPGARRQRGAWRRVGRVTGRLF